MELYLIRHPEPDVAPGVCYGRSDIGLAGDAEIAAARLRAHLPAAAPVYSSPLTRCRTLAARLVPEPLLDARLVEMHFGEWELKRWDDIARAEFDAWAADLLNRAPPGGESAAQMLLRSLEFLADVQRAGLDAASVVTHGGLLRVLVAHWLDLPPRQWSRLSFEFGRVSKVVLGRHGARIDYLNR